MNIVTIEGVTDQGLVRLKTEMRLPDNIKVYVVIPTMQVAGAAPVYSPRLAQPEQLEDFKMEIIEELLDTGL
ncbi:MAG: hypothetical protein M3014_08790 [Chloroflexota bacterium]|nr:hypothetical protein [Chloroflexota bacterium]